MEEDNESKSVKEKAGENTDRMAEARPTTEDNPNSITEIDSNSNTDIIKTGINCNNIRKPK